MYCLSAGPWIRRNSVPVSNTAGMTDMSGNTEINVEARAPGRVNLLGEHTDYNDGFVMPMALPFDTRMSITSRRDRLVRLFSQGFEDVQFSLDTDPREVDTWGRYVAGMARLLAEAGIEVTGFDAHITTTIPVGASLSSSAALEVATGFGLAGMAGHDPDPVSIAKLGQRVENEIIGIQSGIMDQLISAVATAGSATLIDCRTLECRPVYLPASVNVVVMDTMTRRELVDSEYDLRRASCERAAATLGVPALRDASLEQVERLEDDVDGKRARHVISENDRVLQAESALADGDVATFGQLMNQSHESLSNDYEVSSEALDAMAGLAREHVGCLGARMTGGGFAGSAVALVDTESTSEFVTHITNCWKAQMNELPDVWSVMPSEGASAKVM